jgi:hypothetical protein
MKYLIILLVILSLGCGKKEAKVTETLNETSKTTADKNAGESSGVQNADSLMYTIKSFSKSYKGCSDTAFGCTYLKASYPVFTSGSRKDELNSILQAYLTDSLFSIEGVPSNKTFDGLAAALFREYENLKKEFQDFEAGYVLEITSAPVFNSRGILTVSAGNYSYMGGAHPNSYLKYFVFDINSGKLFKTEDIFEPGFEKKLNKMIEKKFRKQFELGDNKPLTEILFENKIEFNNNFAITKDGINFFYNRYEIMAYVYGEAEISFSYGELKGLLKEKFVLQ